MANAYTFRQKCRICSVKPTLKATGTCAVCESGKPTSIWDWLYEPWTGRELHMAQAFLKDITDEYKEMGLDLPKEHVKRITFLLARRKGM